MQGRGEFRVSVEKDYLVFASAHFITMSGHRCEGLHGHNYRARVTIEGALNEENWFVFDFVEIKRIMRKLCDEIDHLVLLPTESSRIQVVEEGERVTVAVDGQPRYVFLVATAPCCRSRTRPWKCWRSCSPTGCVFSSRRPAPAG